MVKDPESVFVERALMIRCVPILYRILQMNSGIIDHVCVTLSITIT